MRALVFTAVALALPLGADTLHVPAQYPTIQAAIDAAQPDDTIVVRGGEHDPIVIDKPLTILGDPQATLAPIRLAGPGSGRVVLWNLRVIAHRSCLNYSVNEPGIRGGGFGELQIHDSEVRGRFCIAIDGDCCYAAAPALDTDVAQVLVSHSSLFASDSDSGSCGPLPPPGQPAILAPSSTVTVLDSTVHGSGVWWLCSEDACFSDEVLESLLAPAVEAATLYLSTNSRLQGGKVSHNQVKLWMGYPIGYTYEACPTPQGPALTIPPRFLPNDLQDFGELALGQVWTLYWETPGPFQVLYLTRRPLLPPLQTPRGLEFLDFTAPILPRVFAGSGPTAWSLRIPLNVSLIGLPITAQVFDTQSGYTRPIVDVVGPGGVFSNGKVHPAPTNQGVR